LSQLVLRYCEHQLPMLQRFNRSVGRRYYRPEDVALVQTIDRLVNLAEVLEEVLAATGYTSADIDWVVPHQANRRILDATARKLGLPIDKIIVTVDRHANTSAASVPLAFDVARRDGRLKTGDLVMLEAMGGGFTWGASLVRL
jgi:3-oxoacyl-[acyl-carrier-protein] synthase-3